MKKVAEMVRNVSAGMSDSDAGSEAERELKDRADNDTSASAAERINPYYNPTHTHSTGKDKHGLKDWVNSTSSAYPMKETRLMRTMAIKIKKPRKSTKYIYTI